MRLRQLIQEARRILVATPGFENLDVVALLAQRNKLREQGAGTAGATTTANVGGFAVPLGGRISRPDPKGPADVVPAYPVPTRYPAPPKIRIRKRKR